MRAIVRVSCQKIGKGKGEFTPFDLELLIHLKKKIKKAIYKFYY